VFFSLTAAAVFSGLLSVGCEPGERFEYGNEECVLILPAGQAWIANGSNDNEGHIYDADGRVFVIKRDQKQNWSVDKEGVYSIRGDTVTLNYGTGESIICKIKISSDGNTLTRTVNGSPEFFTRKSGVSIELPPANPHNGGNLALDANQAWINDKKGELSLIFRSNNTVTVIKERDDGSGVWEIYDEGKYATDNGAITMVLPKSGQILTGTYTVYGDKLVMTILDIGGTKSFTKKSGIIPVTPPVNPPIVGGNSLVGDWKWEFNGNDDNTVPPTVNQKGGVSFKLNGEMSRRDFYDIGKAWIKIEESGNWERKEDGVIYTYVENNKAAKRTYEIKGDKLVGKVCPYYDDRKRCTETTLTKFDADEEDMENSLGTIYTTDPAIRGDWVLQDNDAETLYFGTIPYFGGEGNLVNKEYMGNNNYDMGQYYIDRYIDRYYYTSNDMVFFWSIIFKHNEDGSWTCVNLFDNNAASYSISGSGNDRILTIRDIDVWKIKPDPDTEEEEK